MSTNTTADESHQSTGFVLGRLWGFPVIVERSWLIVAVLITAIFAPVAERAIPGIGPARFLVSAAFAMLLYASILVHEFAHALLARHFGVRVRRISIQLLGGLTEMDSELRRPSHDAVVSGAGPLVSLGIGALALAAAELVSQVANPVVHFLVLELAWANLLVGAFNLLPGFPLDGGHVVRAGVWKVTGSRDKGNVVAGQVGRVVAVAVLVYPFVASGGVPGLVSLLWSLMLAGFMWQGASAAIRRGRLGLRMGHVTAADLTHWAAVVPAQASVGDALRAATANGGSAVIVVDAEGRPVGLLHPHAATAVPTERRDELAVTSVARNIGAAVLLRAEASGDDMINAFTQAGAVHEGDLAVVSDGSGRLGVLTLADLVAYPQRRAVR